MDSITYEDQVFEKVSYSGKSIRNKEFQNCTFKSCDFSNADFSRNKFLDCHFNECNLSQLKLHGATLNNGFFKDSKILGVNFSECLDFMFSVSFDSCILDYASFGGKRIVKGKFLNCSLKEVSFTQANLNAADFSGSDLNGAVFNRTVLTSANLATALNYQIDPELNTLKKAIFSIYGLQGLLIKYDIVVTN